MHRRASCARRPLQQTRACRPPSADSSSDPIGHPLQTTLTGYTRSAANPSAQSSPCRGHLRVNLPVLLAVLHANLVIWGNRAVELRRARLLFFHVLAIDDGLWLKPGLVLRTRPDVPRGDVARHPDLRMAERRRAARRCRPSCKGLFSVREAAAVQQNATARASRAYLHGDERSKTRTRESEESRESGSRPGVGESESPSRRGRQSPGSRRVPGLERLSSSLYALVALSTQPLALSQLLAS